MRSDNGFAVITALLVLVVVGALAVGAFFLTTTNLQLAQNSRTQTVAKYNAELWLDVALITVSDGYVALGRMPTLSELRPYLITNNEYEVTRYSVGPLGDCGEVQSGEIQVTGLALRGDSGAAIARHPVSARFEGYCGGGGSAAGPGFITPRDINVSGASKLLLNMHAGTSLNVSGNVDVGGTPELAGLYSFMSGTGGCSLGTAGQCTTGATPPAVSAVDWDGEYAAAMAEFCPTGPNPAYTNGSTTTINVANSPLSAGQVICLPESGTFTIKGGPLRDVTIVGGAKAIVKLEAGSEKDSLSTRTPPDFGVRLIAGEIYLTSNNTLKDRNFVLAHGNVILDRGVTQTQVEEVDEDGVPRLLTVVKTAIKAGNDVVFSGSGGSGTYAQIITNGKFCRNGNGGAKFVGTIIAGAGTPNGTLLKNNERCGDNLAFIDFRGGGGWTASLPDRFDVEDPTPPVPTGIIVTSRRP